MSVLLLAGFIRRAIAPKAIGRPPSRAPDAASAIWAKEFQGSRVTVNVLIPGGPTDTRMVPPSPPFARRADPAGGDGAACAVARLARLGWRHRRRFMAGL